MRALRLRLSDGLWRRRRIVLAFSDLLVWFVFLELGAIARFDGAIGQVNQRNLALTALAVALTHLALAAPLRLYQGRYGVGTSEEARALAAVVLPTGLVFALVLGLLPGPHLIPASVPLIAAFAALVGAWVLRALIRILREGAARPRDARDALVFGAGSAGSQLVRSMLTDENSPYLPVALLDDDPRLRRRRINGVDVVGNRTQIGAAARRTRATVLIVALPSADAQLLLEISRIAAEHRLEVKTLPPLKELLTGEVGIRDVRDIDLADILGRRSIETDIDSIAGYLTGKRVLVTGAGGSIGSELCRQIHRFHPAELIMLDRDESALHAVELALYGSGLLNTPRVVLADIRDAVTIEDIFRSRKPEVVFHAAALKHLPMLEQYPAEAWKSNVVGTINVLAASANVQVERFVNISTDKAANPTSVLGRSKRIAERLTAHYAGNASGTFLSVRFGNVLGSRGSVLSTFAAQIANGGPVMVTDPDVTRYFMTVNEAVELVIQAAAIGSPGEVLVLDMGKPIRIDDVARKLVAAATHHIDIVYTGLRGGEKLHEDLLGDTEPDHRPIHQLISHVQVPPLRESTVLVTPRGFSMALIELSGCRDDNDLSSENWQRSNAIDSVLAAPGRPSQR